MDELSLSLFTVVILAKIEEKLGALSAMKPKKSEFSVLETCGKEHTFQRALDNSRELEYVIDPQKNQRRSCRPKTRVSKSIENKN